MLRWTVVAMVVVALGLLVGFLVTQETPWLMLAVSVGFTGLAVAGIDHELRR